ncbi:putative GIY-YIG superfamily endonuclease [Bradyrhizobium sp. CIR3A]|nr:putative GIY-YIG superfamily endonuclease [Bradyrhizobium sp. CIR3A]NYG48980.1 putative GIY-YIG superfamily endonuclease [Bradyrhizobium sp. IAR9]
MSPRCYYILASKIGGTLCIGITNDLIRRVAQHKLKLIESFTKDYGVVGWSTSSSSMPPRMRSSGKSA